MSNVAVGMGIKVDEETGEQYGVLQISVEKTCQVAFRFTDQKNYEQDIAALIGGLMQVRSDFKESATGLIVAKGVDDASLRNPQGGKQRGKGS
jgi:hypothetical protein